MKAVRDKRSPIPKNKNVSRVMQANRSKNTMPELRLRRELWRIGKRGYRLHKRIAGTRPDIVYTTDKLAVFINGCFWHRCPICKLKLPLNNRDYWKDKFRKNKGRDVRKRNALQNEGWRVITVWECEINSDIKKVVRAIR